MAEPPREGAARRLLSALPPRAAQLRGPRRDRGTRRRRTRPTLRSRRSCVREDDLQCVRARRRQLGVRLRRLAWTEAVSDDAAGELRRAGQQLDRLRELTRAVAGADESQLL